MTDLAGFLLARLAEDEAAARAADPEEIHWLAEYGASATSEFSEVHIARHDPARVLAECAAKRAIVDWVIGAQVAAGDPPGFDPADAEALTHALRLLAQPYADHPDFDPAWRIDETPTSPH